MVDNLPPVGRYSPTSGLIIDRTGNAVAISGAMELFGEAATPDMATTLQNTINTAWTQSFPDGHTVTCSVRIQFRVPGAQATGLTTINARRLNDGVPSETDNYGRRDILLNVTRRDATTWVIAHEFGHSLGLDDRYSETVLSKLFGGRQIGSYTTPRDTSVEAGYEGRMMGATGGTVDGQTATDLVSETTPSPNWINSDNAIRNWIAAHSRAELARIAIRDRLTMFRTLMEWWISDEDVAAMRAICASVGARGDATTLRNGVNLSDFTDLGQRTTIRVAFAQMP
ncbi:MAG: hypothetical protein IPL88_07275 [Rhizobiales bacterium]|nr:hypothetical protein [Hyphomicrobiales bacterium]